MADDKMEEILTTAELAEYLKIDKATVYRLAKNSQIPAFKIGRQWRFNKLEIIEFTKAGDEFSNLRVGEPP